MFWSSELLKGRSSQSIWPSFTLHRGRWFSLQPPHPSINTVAFEKKTLDLGRLSLVGIQPRLWHSLSASPQHLPGQKGERGRLCESRFGPGVEEGSAASPWGPFSPPHSSPRVLAQLETTQQSPIPHHQFGWVRVPVEAQPSTEMQGRATWGIRIRRFQHE